MKIMNKTRQQLTDFFLQGLKEEKLPWRAVWDQRLPRNAATLKEYRGVNNLILSVVGMLRSYDDPRWCTFLQAKQNGWSISKGAKGVPVEYWAFVDPKIQKMLSWKEVRRIKLEEPERMEQLVLRCKISTVFNAADIIGIPEYLPEAPRFEVGAVRDQRNTILKNMHLAYEEHGSQAYYSPAEDKVVLPPERSFESTYGYLCTFLHECGHASAHPSRLNRDLGDRGTENYAREELRAEIASAFTSQALHLKMEDAALDENLDLHKAYIQGWIGLLEDRPQELFEAIRDAEKISDYLLAMGEFSFEQRAAYLSSPVEITAGSITFVLKNCWARGGYYLSVNGSGSVREEDCTRALRPYRAHISELHVAEGITEIGNRSFQKMPVLQTVALPHSLQRIGHWGFDGCGKLNTIEFSGSISEWDAIKKGSCFLPKQFSDELSRAAAPFNSGLPEAASAVRTDSGTLQLISQDVADAEEAFEEEWEG